MHYRPLQATRYHAQKKRFGLEKVIYFPGYIHEIFYCKSYKPSRPLKLFIEPYQSGSGYDNDTGIFTATYEGIYSFSMTSHSHFGDWTYLHLVYNDNSGQHKVVCSGLDGNKNVYDNIGCSMVLHMKPAEQVFVKLAQGRLRTDPYSVFSGVRRKLRRQF